MYPDSKIIASCPCLVLINLDFKSLGNLIIPLNGAFICSANSPVNTPPVWKVRIVSCVPGSPIDCAAIIPTASPKSTSEPCAKFQP